MMTPVHLSFRMFTSLISRITQTDFEEIWSSLVTIICYMGGEETRQNGERGKRDCRSVRVLLYNESMCYTRPKYAGRCNSRKVIPLVRKRQMFFCTGSSR